MSSFQIPESARRVLEEQGWDGVTVIEPDDEPQPLPVALPDDDIPFPEAAAPEQQALAESGLEPLPPLPPLGSTGPARARSDDPVTSRLAAQSVGDLRESQLAVLLLFDRLGAMTDEQAAEAYERAVQGDVAALHDALPMPRQSPSGLRTRRDELVTLGYLADTGEKALLSTGRSAIVWGRTALAIPS